MTLNTVETRRWISSHSATLRYKMLSVGLPAGFAIVGVVTILRNYVIGPAFAMGIASIFCALWGGVVFASMYWGIKHIEMDETNLYIRDRGSEVVIPKTLIGTVHHEASIVTIQFDKETELGHQMRFAVQPCRNECQIDIPPIVKELSEYIASNHG